MYGPHHRCSYMEEVVGHYDFCAVHGWVHHKKGFPSYGKKPGRGSRGSEVCLHSPTCTEEH